MGMNPHANGGLLLRDLQLPDFRKYAVKVDKPGVRYEESTACWAGSCVTCSNSIRMTRNFRIMGPDETESNRLGAVFEATDRMSMAEILPTDEHVSRTGRVMEV